MGLVSPVGNECKTAWGNLAAGKSGIDHIRSVDSELLSQLSVRIAGEVHDFDALKYIAPKEVKKLDRFIQYGIAAGTDAVMDAGLSDNEADWERIGVAIGSGIGGIQTIDATSNLCREKSASRISPLFIPNTITNMISGRLSIAYKFGGPNTAVVTACTTGTHCIGDSYRMITYGDADVMVCGGSEAAITPLAIGGFANAKALSANNDNPTAASRPFDIARDGFILAEGAGVLVLEEYERAARRQANIYGEIIGYGVSADCHHITAPPSDGAGASRSMKNALNDAKITAEDIDYINAHGTSTPLGDVAETVAIKKTFANNYRALMVSSTKSMTGHLLGAAGGVEAIFTVLSIYNKTVLPTINLDNPDPACDLDYVANTARDADIKYAMSNSFGFGGTNGSLVFSAI